MFRYINDIMCGKAGDIKCHTGVYKIHKIKRLLTIIKLCVNISKMKSCDKKK